MNITRYLDRINYHEEINTSPNTLSKLMEAHLQAVPFENLDIHFGRPIVLTNSYNKIILDKRGGFCYELNGLFFELLQAIGFHAYLVSARVCNNNGSYGAEFDHLAIIVSIDNEKYLADVGFGDFSFTPLKIELDIIQTNITGIFKISQFDDNYLVVSKHVNGQWVNEYIFTLTKRDISEFEGMLHYHQTSPESHFTQNKLCSLPTNSGRITLSGNKLKVTNGSNSTIKTLYNDLEYNEVLLTHFGIRIIL